MKNKAINALIEMGMPANVKGFHYIAEAMALLEEDPSWKPGKTGEGYLDAVEKYLTLQNTTNGNLLATLYLRLSQEG